MAVTKTRREKVLIRLMVAGIIWVFVYTLIAVGLMINMSYRIDANCVSRQHARIAIREGFMTDSDWSPEAQAKFDLKFPPLKC